MTRSKFRPIASVFTQSHAIRAGRTAMVMALGLSLAACGGIATNRSLDSIHQPVVSHASYSLDVNATSNGLASGEARRLGDWLSAMDLRYGDRVSLEDPLASEQTRAEVAAAVAHFGLLLQHETTMTAGYVNAGTARVVLVRASATVPHCPDWSDGNESNPNNATSRNYGCAVNSNLAAMIANPDDLIKGAKGNGESSAQRSERAINALYAAPTSGTGGALKTDSTKSGS
jgi:pilus assembly protein CpaD